MNCQGRNLQDLRENNIAQGAAPPEPSRLVNPSLDGNTRRAIDFHEGEKIKEAALKTLVRAAVTLNKAKAKS